MTDASQTSDEASRLVSQMRESLLKRANDYAGIAKVKLGTVSDRCAGDGKFLRDVELGKNFTIDRYQRAMDWLDNNWPVTGEAA